MTLLNPLRMMFPEITTEVDDVCYEVDLLN